MKVLTPCRRRIMAALALFWTPSVASAQAAQVPDSCVTAGPLEIVESTTMSAKGDAELPAFVAALPMLRTAAAAWDIVLEVQDPRSLDLELEVYDQDPKSGMPGDPVCVSNQPGSIKRCRVQAERFRGQLWARPTAVGTGSTDYRISVRPLTGPAIGDTGLFAGDAQPAPGTFVGTFESSPYLRADAAATQQLFCVNFSSSSMLVQLTQTRGAGLYTLSVFGRDSNTSARLLSESAMALSNASVFVPVPDGVRDGYVLVRLAGSSGAASGYSVDLADRTDWRGTVAEGYVYRTLLSDADYARLGTFGRCYDPGSTPDPSVCRDRDDPSAIYEFLRRVAWGIVPASATPTSDPIIVFVGVDRLSTTLLLEPTDKGSYADPRQTVLRSRGSLWTIYVEDDHVQFETFATVRFSQGDVLQEYILERPASRETIRASAAGRKVRIGVKRYQSDRAPVNVLVTFSREGQNYERQAWSRTYRLRDRSKIAVTFGLTVVANDVRANAHQIVLTQPEFRRSGAEAEIAQVHYRRWLFGSALFSWPGIRARCAEERGTFWLPCANWRAFFPNISIGLGVPMGGPNTWLLGANWPISGMDILQFTAGVTATRQEKLLPGIRPDTLISRNANIDSFVYHDVTYTPLFGLTVDFGAVARRFR